MYTKLPKIEDISELLRTHLQIKPPALLFHYTSAEGCVGILKSKEMWATNSIFFNDSKEHEHAIEYAKGQLNNLLNNNIHYKNKWTPEERKLLERMHGAAGSAARRYYVISFSEEGDLLSQWRAYCPDTGGYSIGFPILQLQNMARKYNFILAKCIYDINEMGKITSQMLFYFVRLFNEQRKNQSEEEAIKDVSWQYNQTLRRIAAVMKHPSFSEEKEWRLISPSVPDDHSRMDYRGSKKGIIPYYKFPLQDDEFRDMVFAGHDFQNNPEEKIHNCMRVVAAPSVDSHRTNMALQFFLRKYANGAVKTVSSIPYRTW